ncbi:MAG: DUF222 domain-containing protein [Jatrophihabitantaceae bacterium]
MPAAERLIQLLELPPAARPTGEIALFEPRRLSPGARIDLLTLLEQQKHWLDSVQQRVLAEIDAADASELGLSQEAVSLAVGVPTRTAQTKLKTASLLVRELPDTLALLHAGKISYRHAEVICEQVWSLPADLMADFEALALARADDQTIGQLRQAARRAVAGSTRPTPRAAISKPSPVAVSAFNHARTAWCCYPSCWTRRRGS